MSKKIIFWGGTGQAKVIREVVEHFDYELIAVFDNDRSVAPPFPDVSLYYGMDGFRKWKDTNDVREVFCLVTMGGHARDQVAIQEFLENEGLCPVIAVHPSAYVAADATLAKGCQVLPHATITVGVKVGEASILNAACNVNHGSTLGRGVHIAPGATLAGLVAVGNFTFIGAGAVVLPRVKIGSDVMIGAGSVVTRDIPDGVVAYGNPAKVRRANVA
jgi:sugar O-acyltransferase (sialic acid O-acetyltransferase NeuD family)